MTNRNKRRFDPKFKVGDLVLLRKSSRRIGTCRKLSLDWTGPYEILSLPKSYQAVLKLGNKTYTAAIKNIVRYNVFKDEERDGILPLASALGQEEQADHILDSLLEGLSKTKPDTSISSGTDSSTEMKRLSGIEALKPGDRLIVRCGDIKWLPGVVVQSDGITVEVHMCNSGKRDAKKVTWLPVYQDTRDGMEVFTERPLVSYQAYTMEFETTDNLFQCPELEFVKVGKKSKGFQIPKKALVKIQAWMDEKFGQPYVGMIKV